MTPRVGVIDHGSGNLHSVCKALAVAGASVVLSSRHAELAACDGIVLPGVGAFAACMAGIRSVGGDELVHDLVRHGRPLLGICVGHQVLFERGIEHGVPAAGLGLLRGVVERLTARRLPHMGWNEVDAPSGPMFAGVTGERFYFVHSYAVQRVPLDGTAEVGWCDHDGDRFVAAVASGPIWSTQFHPEKSGAAGAHLLANWLGQLSPHH